MTTSISIAVFKGEPLDYMEFRHTSLYFKFSDGTETLAHVKGSHGFFNYEAESTDPTKINGLDTQFYVATVPADVNKQQILDACRTTPVRNDPQHKDWNCQNWVGEALQKLVEINCITSQKRKEALDRMTDIILEAKDEQYA